MGRGEGARPWSSADLPPPPPRPVARRLAFKTLVDDSVWQVGANEQVALPGGTTQPNAYAFVTVYPWYATTQGS
jgi:hypothetical protein